MLQSNKDHRIDKRLVRKEDLWRDNPRLHSLPPTAANNLLTHFVNGKHGFSGMTRQVEIRNPKHEARNKNEIQNSNCQNVLGLEF